MSRPIKLPLKSLQDVKKQKVVSIATAAAGIVILLLVIFGAVKASSAMLRTSVKKPLL